MLGGTLMGMTWLGYAALLYTFDPPEHFKRRIEAGTSTTAAMAVAVGALFGFAALGSGAALVADSSMPGIGGQLSLAPSALYAAMVVTLSAVAAVPAIAFMRGKLAHLAIWVAMAVVIYGVLIPNLVIALQNRV